MNISILTADSQCMRLVHHILQQDRHRILSAYGCDAFAEVLARHRLPLFPADQWMRLMHEPDCQAVIVGTGADIELRSEALRKLVQAGMPLIVSHPICEMLLSFELQMIQSDSHSLIVPYYPEFAQQYQRLVAPLLDPQQDFGQLQQVTIERIMLETDRASVERQFVRDALLFRQLLGKIDRLNAIGAQPYPAEDWNNLSIHMNAANGAVARWSVTKHHPQDPTDIGEPASKTSDVSGELSVRTAGRKFSAPLTGESDLIDSQLAQGPESGEDRQNNASSRETAPRSSTIFAEESWPIELLAAAGDDRSIAAQLWDDACRAAELADTIDASYRRKKTIELYHEEHSEEETFKSMMAAGGCLAMMFTLMIVPALAILEQLRIPWLEGAGWQRWPWRLFYWRNWPIFLLGCLALFLALQFLRLLFRSDSNNSSDTQLR